MGKNYLYINIIAYSFCLFLSSVSFGYGYRLKTVINEDTNKIVYLLYDVHAMGSKQDNLIQKNDFMNDFINSFSIENIPLMILVEYPSLYFIDMDDARRKSAFSDYFEEDESHQSAFFCPVKKDFEFINFKENSLRQTTWILEFVKEVGRRNLPNISLKSIDPRLPRTLWRVDLESNSGLDSFLALLSMADRNPDLNHYMLTNSDSLLAREILKFNSQLTKDAQELFAETDLFSVLPYIYSHSNQALIKSGIISREKLDDVGNLLLKKRPELFMNALDKIALWEIAKPDAFQHTLLFAGGRHNETILESLKKLGYKEKFASQELISTGQKGLPVIEGTENLKIPQGLQEEMKISFSQASRVWK